MLLMHAYSAYIFDLDGTAYLGDTLLPTAGETVQTLRALSKRTVFLSNNPTHTRYTNAQKLTRLETDVHMGRQAGMDAALILTGATPETALADSMTQPTYVLRQLSDVLDWKE